MKLFRILTPVGIILFAATVVSAQQIQWRAAGTASQTPPAQNSTAPLRLGRPVPVGHPAQAIPAHWRAGRSPQRDPSAIETSPNIVQTAHQSNESTWDTHHPTAYGPQPIFRAQGGGVLPVPPPPDPGAIPATEEPYNCSVPTDPLAPGVPGVPGVPPPDGAPILPGFFGEVMPAAGPRGFLQTDHAFDSFSSPMTNPFYFEDPRALTEVKALYIHQEIPGSNPVTGGGEVSTFSLQARLAITERISVVVNRLGYLTINPATGAVITDESGFSEFQIGPKFVVYRDDCSQTIASAGLTFTLPIGDGSVFQDTGTLGLTPYFSFGQEFLKSSWGSFHFLNTTGYHFGIEDDRTEFLFSSFHLDYDVAGWGWFYPFVEMNYFLYTQDGGVRPLTFEGRDLINFGSTMRMEDHDLSIAVGSRFKVWEWLQFGGAIEFPLLDRGIQDYRLTFDLILRY